MISNANNQTRTYREGDDERIPPPDRRGIFIVLKLIMYTEKSI